MDLCRFVEKMSSWSILSEQRISGLTCSLLPCTASVQLLAAKCEVATISYVLCWLSSVNSYWPSAMEPMYKKYAATLLVTPTVRLFYGPVLSTYSGNKVLDSFLYLIIHLFLLLWGHSLSDFGQVKKERCCEAKCRLIAISSARIVQLRRMVGALKDPQTTCPGCQCGETRLSA